MPRPRQDHLPCRAMYSDSLSIQIITWLSLPSSFLILRSHQLRYQSINLACLSLPSLSMLIQTNQLVSNPKTNVSTSHKMERQYHRYHSRIKINTDSWWICSSILMHPIKYKYNSSYATLYCTLLATFGIQHQEAHDPHTNIYIYKSVKTFFEV